MALFAISDLHLSFGVDKPMNVFGRVWKDYEKKIEKNWINQVNTNDTVIIAGDISWGIDFSESQKDFEYINNMPGKKIILRGNHDYYFSTKTKVENFLKESKFDTISVLHNNAFDLENYILCGARGWGITENTDKEADKKIILREEGRLKISIEEAKKIQEKYKEKGRKKDIIAAMHFPPFTGNFQKMLEENNIKKCVYGHLHGYGHSLVKEGNINGVEYIMVGCDYTKFKLIAL